MNVHCVSQAGRCFSRHSVEQRQGACLRPLTLQVMLCLLLHSLLKKIADNGHHLGKTLKAACSVEMICR